ncbi:MAG: LPS export ABC transporter periplasmic protein LptC [Gemmatimonadota bacterium]
MTPRPSVRPWASIVGEGALVLATVLAAAGCGEDGAGPVGEVPDSIAAQQVIYALVHTITAEGVRRARLEADTAYFHGDDDRVDLRAVRLVLFDENGRDAAVVTSREGELNQRTQEMTAQGDVVVVAEDGERRLETEELHYDPRTERVWSDVETRFYRGDDRGRGDSFTSNRMRDLEVRNPSGTIEGWDGSP